MGAIRHTFRRRLVLLVSVVVWLALTGRALAAPSARPATQGGVIQVGQDWVLAAGSREEGDVLVISADAIVEADATLKGSLTVISGDAVIGGIVNGDVNVISGDVILKNTSRVTGDVNIVSGEVNQAPGAQVEGDIVRGDVRLGTLVNLGGTWNTWFPAFVQGIGPWTQPEPWTLTWFVASLLQLIVSLLRSLVIAIGVAAIGVVIVLLWPDGIQSIAQTVERAFLPSLGIGVLTWFAGGIIIALLIVTICFAILGLAGLAALVGLSLLGWTALGKLVGERLWQALGFSGASSVWPTATGTFLITLLSRIPCVGVIFGAVLGSVALGAAIVTLYTRYNGRRALPAG